MKVGQAVMVLCYKIIHKYKELLPFLLYLMIASIYYVNTDCTVKIYFRDSGKNAVKVVL